MVALAPSDSFATPRQAVRVGILLGWMCESDQRVEGICRFYRNAESVVKI